MQVDARLNRKFQHQVRICLNGVLGPIMDHARLVVWLVVKGLKRGLVTVFTHLKPQQLLLEVVEVQLYRLVVVMGRSATISVSQCVKSLKLHDKTLKSDKYVPSVSKMLKNLKINAGFPRTKNILLIFFYKKRTNYYIFPKMSKFLH